MILNFPYKGFSCTFRIYHRINTLYKKLRLTTIHIYVTHINCFFFHTHHLHQKYFWHCPIQDQFLYRRIKGEVPAEDYTVPIGKAVVRREGKHLTILSYAAMMHTSLEAADALAQEGIEAEVIDLRTLLPLDEETILNSVKKTNKCLVVHEDTKTGGIAGEIAALLCEKAFSDLDGPVLRTTSLDTPVPYAPTLEEQFLPNAKKVFSAAKELARY